MKKQASAAAAAAAAAGVADLSKSQKTTHFFLMGCWNNDNCPNDGGDGMDYRSGVLKQIEKTHEKHAFDFGVVAGDNVYPHKPSAAAVAAGGSKKKVKYYYAKTLKYGNEMLRKSVGDIPLYYVLGNHDVVKQDVLDYHEKHLKPLAASGGQAQGFQYMKTISKHLKLVVVDTNLLQKNITDTIKRKYNIETPQEGFAILKTFLESVREDCLKTGFRGFTLVVGHEPLLTVKQKIDERTKKESLKVDSLVLYDEFLVEMGRLSNAIYMCADVHAFQVWNLQAESVKAGAFAVPMVVVGTGGGSPDENPVHPVIHLNRFEGERLKLMKPELVEAQPSYGFADIEVFESGSAASPELRIRYHPLKYCSSGQYEASYKVKLGAAPGAADAGALHMLSNLRLNPVNSPSKKRVVYEKNPEKCMRESGVKPTLDGLCRDTSAERPMDGGGRYNRVMHTILVADYVVYRGHRHRIHRDSSDRRRKYIQTNEGRVYAPDYHA
jgi:hypothetical protein